MRSAEELLLDECHHRRMIAVGVRHVMRLREGRHGNERHANTELIEAGTIDRKRIGRICRSTKLSCKHLADRAIHPAQKQFVCRALPGAYSVRRALSALLRGR